jgi:hypothetical protein
MHLEFIFASFVYKENLEKLCNLHPESIKTRQLDIKNQKFSGQGPLPQNLNTLSHLYPSALSTPQFSHLRRSVDTTSFLLIGDHAD